MRYHVFNDPSCLQFESESEKSEDESPVSFRIRMSAEVKTEASSVFSLYRHTRAVVWEIAKWQSEGQRIKQVESKRRDASRSFPLFTPSLSLSPSVRQNLHHRFSTTRDLQSKPNATPPSLLLPPPPTSSGTSQPNRMLYTAINQPAYGPYNQNHPSRSERLNQLVPISERCGVGEGGRWRGRGGGGFEYNAS